MGDSFTFGTINAGAVASGTGATAHGSLIQHTATADDVSALRQALAALASELRRRDPAPAVLEAEARLRELEVVATPDAAPEQVASRWQALRHAVEGIDVVANLTQIASFVQPFLS